MEKEKASIFNDVIGPVMRGPSSSHVAGAARIGALLRQSLRGELKKVVCDFDINGSLAESYEGHGTAMGFACGLMDIPLTDNRVDRYRQLIKESGIGLEYRILDYGAEHPNHYRMQAFDCTGDSVTMDAISTGGGMIEVTTLDGFEISVLGGFYEAFFVSGKDVAEGDIKALVTDFQVLSRSEKDGFICYNIKTSQQMNDESVQKVKELLEAEKCRFMQPILPTMSVAECTLPFTCAAEMLEYNRDKGLAMWELAALYESTRGGCTKEKVFSQMTELLEIISGAVDNGLKGTVYSDRILHAQASRMDIESVKEKQVPGSVMNTAIKYITAIMETKSSMGVIVAAPTAGSCGCLPGTLLALEAVLGLPREETVKGMLAAGLIGVFFAEGATFAAEVGGCQMECGAGSGMAAAGVAQMMGASAEQCVDAASVALQGLTGLACDPVANRVEVPCLNKNIVGGMNALSSTNMILAGFDKVIPLDETIAAMYDIGLKLPLELRCTFGGLGKTKTSLKIRKALEEKQ